MTDLNWIMFGLTCAFFVGTYVFTPIIVDKIGKFL